ncbi:Phosphoenolpyruvate carboxykinase (ATP) [Liberibacter crescens BT-1]|uniref:Phosphoenolpyruvate carboxykinase (ATP) n=1 Tax=Liberibacter crescens (strain BT-1) TaxID=1215343 RepID=L0EWK6_LIBCB|nr:phosphoenolpyruvate carboxykinase [Liberibacter crescens]AGA65347.1 Phosphoenolpyruvate carboxykinase (ATP) [Liberibacter crescens BT-1]AMC12288.1 phosphoenolpyruvate carboxykinase [Liberibacter crescens]
MKEIGLHNLDIQKKTFELEDAACVYYNLNTNMLYEESIRRCESNLTSNGVMRVITGHHTGRSPKDKFILKDDITCSTVFWENNNAISIEHFSLLKTDMLEYIKGKELFVQDLIACNNPKHELPVRVITELCWHSLFIRNLLISLDRKKLSSFVPQLTIIDIPSFNANPDRHGCRSKTVIAVDLKNGIVLIGGTSYAGEIKKSVFTFLNYIFPKKGIMPMHCSANVGKEGDVALFFGLSGTGKTTLSADSSRVLIGDDEHGWADNGIFNFEGGCYAKTINLSEKVEPEIFSAAQRFGTVLENVVIDDDGVPDFKDSSFTENTRAAYPLCFIKNSSDVGMAAHPKNVIMLTADAFGVLPPVSRLTPEQAMYYFLSGYTAKVSGTEKGILEPEATFSTCFGAPFMPRHPVEYGNLLKDFIIRHNVRCWLVNTGWIGGPYGIGKRISIVVTRAILKAIFEESIHESSYRIDKNFGFSVPLEIIGVDKNILDPRLIWSNSDDYDVQSEKLISMFSDNFVKFESSVDNSILSSAVKKKSKKTL